MVLFTTKVYECSTEELWGFLLDRKDYFVDFISRRHRYFNYIISSDSRYATFCTVFISACLKPECQHNMLADLIDESVKEFVRITERERYHNREFKNRMLPLEHAEEKKTDEDICDKLYVSERAKDFRERYIKHNKVEEQDITIANQLLDAMLLSDNEDYILSNPKFKNFMDKYPQFCYNYPNNFGKYLRNNLRRFYKKFG